MSTTFENPAFSIGGYRDLHWVEAAEAKALGGKFRDANDYLEDRGPSSLARITGYYTDVDEFGETAVPAVFVTAIVCDDCKGAGCDDCEEGEVFTYYAGMHDPFNDDGSGIVDASEVYSDPAEAARAAHGVAERYAEHQREYQARSREYSEAEEVEAQSLSELRRVRSNHTYLIRALRVLGNGDDASGARLRADKRLEAAAHVEAIREARETLARPDLKEFAS